LLHTARREENARFLGALPRASFAFADTALGQKNLLRQSFETDGLYCDRGEFPILGGLLLQASGWAFDARKSG
jgi:hypothetical protein